MLTDRQKLSQRRACAIVGQHRSTQRHKVTRGTGDDVLRSKLRLISVTRPRWGHRMACNVLRNDGWTVNRKKIQRLWREEGLRVPVKTRKRQRLGVSTVPAARLRAQRINEVWAIDYQHDETADGKTLRLLHVVDEFTREALAIVVARSISADMTVATLERVAVQRATTPAFIRCDNGPELTSHALRDWCRFSGAATSYIQPGAPWQNPFVESFGGRIRDELLSVELFTNLPEAKIVIEDWRIDYNTNRPHSSLGGKPPATYAKMIKNLEQQPA